MAGGLGPAYGQTDVMHDRSYLTANLAHRNPAVRRQSAIQLDNLNQQEAQQQRDAAFQQRQMANEAAQRRIAAHQNAMEMDRQLKIDRDTQIDEDGHGLQLSIMRLDAQLRRGEINKQQYDDGLINAAAQYPLGLKHPEARRHFDFVTEEATRQNAFNNRRSAAEAIKISAKYGVPVQTDTSTGQPSVDQTRALAAKTPQGQIDLTGVRTAPEKIAQRYARVQGTLDQYQTAYDADVKRQEKSNTDAKLANVPYNPNLDNESRIINSNLAGAKTESKFLEHSYPKLNPDNQIQQIPDATATPTPSPTPAPQAPADQFSFLGIPNATPTGTPDSTAAPIYTPSPSPEATATPPPLADIFADQPQTP